MNDDIIELNFAEDLDQNNSFGGLELLMNDKMKKSNRSSSAHMADLEELENDLNILANDNIPTSFQEPASNFFSASNDDMDKSSLGQSTFKTEPIQEQTWDGYGKIPMSSSPPPPPMHTNKEDTLKEKMRLLQKLNNLAKKGVELSKNYTMDSSITEMQGEYDTIIEDLSRKKSIKFQRDIFFLIVQGVESLNKTFDPFDIQLDGLSEKVEDEMDSYDEIFGELHEKYKNRVSVAPELKLLFQLGGSAMMVHLTNSMLKNAAPGVDEIFRQNPDLMRNFQEAALKSMNQTNPGFSGFMNGLMQPPPPPISENIRNTEPPRSVPLQSQNMNFIDTRPNFQDNKTGRYSPTIRPNTSARPDMTMRSDISTRPDISMRPDMQGPKDIRDILSGIKTKNIVIKDTDNQSTISMSELKELNSMDANLPKRPRKKKSLSSDI